MRFNIITPKTGEKQKEASRYEDPPAEAHVTLLNGISC